MTCKRCNSEILEKPWRIDKNGNPFCKETCYDRYRYHASGTPLLPNTKARKDVSREHSLKRREALRKEREVVDTKRVRLQKTSLSARAKVLDYYGNSRCVCCGETIVEFLQIEHLDGIGKYKNGTPRAGDILVSWIIKNNYPPGFSVLCANCNFVKRFGAPCPHSLVRAGIYGQPQGQENLLAKDASLGQPETNSN